MPIEIDINGITPATTRPRKLYVTIGDQGEFMLSTEHPASGNGWAIRITDLGELRQLRDAIDQAIKSPKRSSP
jgi:hypothetical protein